MQYQSAEMIEKALLKRYGFLQIAHGEMEFDNGFIHTGLNGEMINENISLKGKMARDSLGNYAFVFLHLKKKGPNAYYVITEEGLNSVYDYFYRTIESPVRIITDMSVSVAGQRALGNYFRFELVEEDALVKEFANRPQPVH
jgi:hypothetical protein